MFKPFNVRAVGLQTRLTLTALAVLTAACGGLAAFSFTPVDAASKTKSVSAPSKAAPQPSELKGPSQASSPDDLQPILHARAAGVKDCLAAVGAMAHVSLAGATTAVSTWNKQAPNDRLFNSIVGQSNENKRSPQAISVLVASPTAQHACDSTAVEIHPSSLSCQEIERPLAEDKRETKMVLSTVAMIQTDPSLRLMLMPAPNNGCVVVSIRTLYGG